MRWILSFLVLSLLGLAQALSYSGSRLLVVYEEDSEKALYSKFLGDLESRGFTISYETAKSSSINLFRHGARAYDHLLLLPTKSKAVSSSLTPKVLLNFMQAEGNILLTLSGESTTPTSVSGFLQELDIQIPSDRTSVVVDHFNYDGSSASEKHDVLLLASQSSKSDAKQFFHADGTVAIPRAVAQVLGNTSPLLTPILRAPATAYSYNQKEEANYAEDPFAVGSQISLVSSVQARNSARCVVVGSAEMLQDAWFDVSVKAPNGKVKTANRHYAEQVSEWAFKETGVLQVGNLRHFQSETAAGTVQNGSMGEINPEIYRIKTGVTYQIELSEYVKDKFVPFEPAQSGDVQLEFTMLSPFHRLSLSPLKKTANSTIFSTSFVLPDQHGIFNFRVNYKRPFLTNVDEKRQVTVRHFAHDEWPRSWAISGAWTWVAGIWTVVAGWLAFVAVWLYSAPNESAMGGRGGTKKTL